MFHVGNSADTSELIAKSTQSSRRLPFSPEAASSLIRVICVIRGSLFSILATGGLSDVSHRSFCGARSPLRPTTSHVSRRPSRPPRHSPVTLPFRTLPFHAQPFPCYLPRRF